MATARLAQLTFAGDECPKPIVARLRSRYWWSGKLESDFLPRPGSSLIWDIASIHLSPSYFACFLPNSTNSPCIR